MSNDPPRGELLALLRAAKADPEDDAPRLVLADWLDERGDPARAELVRLQVARDRLAPYDPRRRELEDREDELTGPGIDAWLASLRPSVTGRGYERGLLKLWLPAEKF